MNYLKIIYSVCVGVMLVGCDSLVDAVEQEMAKIRSEPPLAIEPAPTFMPAPNYEYDAYRLKSPFLATSVANELRIMAGKRVYPNFARDKQPLEYFALESLIMKGSMRNASGKITGLIQSPDGKLEQVVPGSYMGMDYGRVVNITPTQIDLKEIVSDGREGYVERPRSLILIGPAP